MTADELVKRIVNKYCNAYRAIGTERVTYRAVFRLILNKFVKQQIVIQQVTAEPTQREIVGKPLT